MSGKGLLHCKLVALSFLTFGLLNPAFAAEPSPKVRVLDVALGEKGRLNGLMVDRQGKALSDVPVAMTSEGGQPAVAVTTKAGRFAYEGMSGGVYYLAARNADLTVVRAWTAKAAPPHAEAQVILYAEPIPDAPDTAAAAPSGPNPIGQSPQSSLFRSIIANPVILPAAIAAAIAVPIAVSNIHRAPASP